VELIPTKYTLKVAQMASQPSFNKNNIWIRDN
jgi:hypothetical protein